MKRRTLLGGLAAGIAVAGAGPVMGGRSAFAQGTCSDLSAQLKAITSAGVPGVVARIDRGSSVNVLTDGISDVGKGTPVLPNMRQRIGGLSKPFTAVAVLKLVEEGRVELDAPVAKYLPTALPRELGSTITVRMLLNQSSGLADFSAIALAANGDSKQIFSTYDSIAKNANTRWTPQQLVDRALQVEPNPVPGQRWNYSHANYVLLAMMVEKVTGNHFAREVQRRVLAPLRLHNTGSTQRMEVPGAHMGAHVQWHDGKPREFSHYDPSWMFGAADLYSTVHDVNRFFRCLLGGKVLSKSMLAEMKKTVPMDPQHPEFAGYGLGMFFLMTKKGPMWGHDGLVVGQSTYSGHSEDGQARQFTLFTNMNFFPPEGPLGPEVDKARQAFEDAAFAPCLPATGGGPAPRRWPRHSSGGPQGTAKAASS